MYDPAVIAAAMADDGAAEAPMTYTAKATDLGTAAGTAAAAWVFDGNTDDATRAKVLAGIDDGDPAILNAYDHMIPQIGIDSDESIDLAGEVGIDPDAMDPLEALGAKDAAVDAWNMAAGDAFWAEVERSARELLTPAPGEGA
jgi:hypothetical protein